MYYPIKVGKLGNKPHKKSVQQGGSCEFWEQSRKLRKKKAAVLFVMKLTMNKNTVG